jgi:hypothetical protein
MVDALTIYLMGVGAAGTLCIGVVFGWAVVVSIRERVDQRRMERELRQAEAELSRDLERFVLPNFEWPA